MFWLVWNGDRQRVPMYVHNSEEAARKEAERLAREHGGKFVVLCAIALVEKTDIQWRDLEIEGDVPF